MLEFELKDRKISTSRNAFVVGIINANNDSFVEKILETIKSGSNFDDRMFENYLKESGGK